MKTILCIGKVRIIKGKMVSKVIKTTDTIKVHK